MVVRCGPEGQGFIVNSSVDERMTTLMVDVQLGRLFAEFGDKRELKMCSW